MRQRPYLRTSDESESIRTSTSNPISSWSSKAETGKIHCQIDNERLGVKYKVQAVIIGGDVYTSDDNKMIADHEDLVSADDDAIGDRAMTSSTKPTSLLDHLHNQHQSPSITHPLAPTRMSMLSEQLDEMGWIHSTGNSRVVDHENGNSTPTIPKAMFLSISCTFHQVI